MKVPLKSQDFTGLGFNIHGNMRDGIFIKEVLSSGPARDSGKIQPGLSCTVMLDVIAPWCIDSCKTFY